MKSYKDKANERHNYSMDLDDSEEPTQQKINESYKPTVTIQGFLQTDANNIKMNARLIKEKNNLNNMKNKFSAKAKILKSEESTNIGDVHNTIGNNKNTNYETKEIQNTNSNINRILLTEVDNVGVKNIQQSLLNKDNNSTNNNNNNTISNKMNNNNNSIETYSKKMVNNKPKNINISLNLNKPHFVDDYIRINTLYNKDDSEDFSSIKKEINNKNINTKILETENSDSKYISNKTDLGINNISKAINGLNINTINSINNNDNTNHNKNKLIEQDLSLNNSKLNKEKEAEKNKFYITLPVSNQIYKQEKIMKFINHKTSSMPKSKENSKKNIPELGNGKLYINNNINKNKYKYKNRFSQENYNNLYKNIHGINMNGVSNTKPNGSNEINLVSKNMGMYTHLNNFNIGKLNNNFMNLGNFGNILYIKKKRRPKSIDDNVNKKNYLQLKKDSKINISNENKNSNNNSIINNNKEIYLKVNNINNYKKQFHRDKINEHKYIEEPFIETFRYKKLNHNNKLNKKSENDSNNASNFTRRLNTNNLYINNNNLNNYVIEKIKNRENNNKILFTKDIINYTNISINKNNKLHEHNSFEGPKIIKNKIKQNYINSSVEKNKYLNNNTNATISKYADKKNYYKLNKKIKQYYRNIGNTKQTQPVTQYFGINNYNKIINNYNLEKFDKISNEKIQAKNQRLNYKIASKVRANSVDLQGNKSKSNIDKNSNNNNPKVNKIKNQKKSFLNTSVIKDKTPKNFITSFFKEKNKLNNIHRNNFYLNTIENNNLINNTHKNIDENRYMTFKENESLVTTSSRKAHKYLFPVHKRYNFSQEPEKKRKENDILEVFSMYGKGNSFIFNNMNKNNFVFKKEKKKTSNLNNNNNIKEQNNNLTNNTNTGNNVVNLNINRNIYSKTPIDKTKENVEKITGNKVDIKKIKNTLFFDCKYKEGIHVIYFRLNISKNHKDFFTISPILIKGNQNIYKAIVDKIKNKLM